MSVLIPNSFSKYSLDEKEQLQGQILTLSQIYVIQNQISDIAEQILSLDFDPANPLKFTQDEAFLKGQLAAFRFQLESSESAVSQLNSQSPQE